MQCPLNEEVNVGDKCPVKSCLFHSLVTERGCFHGTSVGVLEISKHKGLKRKDVKDHVTRKHKAFVRVVTLHRYLSFVKDKPAKPETVELYDRLSLKLPYSSVLFSDFSANKLQRMRSRKTFKRFCKLNGINYSDLLSDYDGLLDFISHDDKMNRNPNDRLKFSKN